MEKIYSANDLYEQVRGDILSNLDYDDYDYALTEPEDEGGTLIRLPSPAGDGYINIKISICEDPAGE